MPRYDADWVDWMLQAERRGSPPAEETLVSLGLAPGDVVADVGCGPGFYTIPAARLVTDGGRVDAIDVEPTMLDLVQERAKRARVESIVQTHLGSGALLPLSDAEASLTICALLLHDLPDRHAMTRELVRITRPGGQIAVVEWAPDRDDTRPNRLTPDQTKSIIESAGGAVVAVRSLGTTQYLVLANRPDPGATLSGPG